MGPTLAQLADSEWGREHLLIIPIGGPPMEPPLPRTRRFAVGTRVRCRYLDTPNTIAVGTVTGLDDDFESQRYVTFDGDSGPTRISIDLLTLA